jgi:hypothetical protein
VRSHGWFYAFVAKDNVYLDEGFGPFRIVYIYDKRSDDRESVPPGLHRDELLIPIVVCNSTPWTTGKFEYLKKVENDHNMFYNEHSFYCDFFKPIRFFDESGKMIPRPIEPCLPRGMASGQSIDFEIGQKLGLLDGNGNQISARQ